MVDPNAPQGLPPGVPPPGAPMPQDPTGLPGAPGAGANPTTDPAAMTAVLQALLDQGQAQFQGEQQAALATAVTTLLKQQPNVAGEAASTLPGDPSAPPMPSGNDPSMMSGNPNGGY